MTPEETMQVIKSKQDKMQPHLEAWFKANCNSAYHEKEIQTLRDELQEIYMEIKITPQEQAALILAEGNGKTIEVLYTDGKEWKDKTDKGSWDFRFAFYRVKAGQEETEDTKPVPGEIIQFDSPAYTPEPDSPEVKRRYAKVTPLILLMEKWAENEVDLQFKPKGDSEWSDVYGDPLWNFGDMDYQTVPKSEDTVNEVSPKLDQGANEVKLTKAQRDIDRIAKANLHVKEALELYESLEKDNPITVMTQEQLMMAFTCINNTYGLAKKMIKQEKELGNES